MGTCFDMACQTCFEKVSWSVFRMVKVSLNNVSPVLKFWRMCSCSFKGLGLPFAACPKSSK